MIDVSKIRVGDEVTVRGRVYDASGADWFYVSFGASSWAKVPADAIATHSPKPREFKPGDRVTFIDSQVAFDVVHAEGDQAWVKNLNGSMLAPFTELRHADESE
jgi:plastocyanin